MPERIGMIVSAKCAAEMPGGKRWFHVAKFCKAYANLLERYRLVVTDETYKLLAPALEEAGLARKGVQRLGRSFPGLVRMAAKVARKKLSRVLVFQDPRDLQIEKPAFYALLRNCNLSGGGMYFNAAAHLWALWESQRKGIPLDQPYETHPVNSGEIKETVAFIAHDNEKPRMRRFVLHYRHILRRFPRLIATSGTKRHVEEFMKEHVPPRERLKIVGAGATEREAHGPSGGDVIVADEIFRMYRSTASTELENHVLHHILFFIDHKHTQPHEPDIQVLLKTCADPENRVNLILNSRMAEEWADRYGPAT